MYRDLASFITALEQAGELVCIDASVSPILEISEIADRMSKSAAPNLPAGATQRNDPRFHDRGGKALLFTNVEGADRPLLINAFGSYRRMEMAMGSQRWGGDGLESLAETIGMLAKPEPPRGLGEIFQKAKQFLPVLKNTAPKRMRRPGACQEIVRTGADIDLRSWPILRCWPLDGDYASVGYPADVNNGVDEIERGDEWDRLYRGRYITLAGIHTIHADDRDDPKPKSHNIGMYRVQLLGRDRVAMHWHMHHDGAAHWRSWKKLGQPMPVAIALGGPSVLPYAATAPLPPGLSELLMAGFLNGGGIRLCRAKTVPLWVPADAEMVIEGWVSDKAGVIGWDPRETDEPLGEDAVFEGPFGDHTGFYSMPDRYPIVRVSAVTERKNAVYPTTIVGLPPQEDYFLGKATERLFLPLLKVLIPDIEDYDLPMFGAFHNCAFLRIKKQYPLQARRVMHAVWGAGQMAWTKFLFVVDDDVDVHDTRAVMAACARWCEPRRAMETVRGPLDILDHAAPRLGAGTKMGFDCTRPWAGEEANGVGFEEPGRLVPDDAGLLRSRVRGVEGVVDAGFAEASGGIAGWLLVSVHRSVPGDGRLIAERVLEAAGAGGPAFTVVVSEDVDITDGDRTLFHWCANTDAGRDLVRSDDGRVAFDATAKTGADAHAGEPVRAWPPILEMTDAIREGVNGRGSAFGLGG
ncbi:MAG: UbiD family decarboxylase [Planctomycetota bacterium]